MCRFHQSGEFRCGNQRDIAAIAAADDHNFLFVRHPVEDGGEILTQGGVGGFGRHVSIYLSCKSTVILYLLANCYFFTATAIPLHVELMAQTL